MTVVHGWGDDVIPVDHSIQFARKFSAATRLELRIIEDDHRFSNQVNSLAILFALSGAGAGRRNRPRLRILPADGERVAGKN